MDDRKQFLFVNNTKPILADKIRYYEEPFLKARRGTTTIACPRPMSSAQRPPTCLGGIDRLEGCAGRGGRS